MILTIIRHGKAVDREAWHGDDRDRPLTREGREQVRQALRALTEVIQAEEVWTSPWKRARQTAEIAAEVWDLPLTECTWLAGDATEIPDWCRQMRGTGEIVLVGHEPDLGRLVGHLIGGKPLPMKKGGVAILEGLPRPGQMELALFVPPKAVLRVADV
ncbi:MAG: histidine phosphatase family protein [Planctomycetota bacterium]